MDWLHWLSTVCGTSLLFLAIIFVVFVVRAHLKLRNHVAPVDDNSNDQQQVGG
jgi:phosphate starvation-inducible membrane PsiE